MTLFPGEKPEYPEEKPCGYSQRIELRLSRGDIYTTASCLYCDGGGAFRGRAAVRSAELQGKVRTDSLCQQILKLAVYRAVLRSGRERPPWGALTGVRPGKLLTPGSPASPQKQVKAPSTIKSEPVVNELVSPAR